MPGDAARVEAACAAFFDEWDNEDRDRMRRALEAADAATAEVAFRGVSGETLDAGLSE